MLLLPIYVAMLIYSLLHQSILKEFMTTSFVGGVIIIIICSLLFCMEILNSNKILNLQSNLPFFITVGLLIFHVGILPLILLQQHLNIGMLSFIIVSSILNWICAVCYILGFVWTKKK